MRIGVYLKGIDRSKKEEFIRRNKLGDHLVSKSNIRHMYSGFHYSENGNKLADRSYDDKVESLAFDILENRMEKGDFLVYDPEGPNNNNLKRFAKLIKRNNYRFIIVDFKEKENDRLNVIKKDANSQALRLGSNKIGSMFDDLMNISEHYNAEIVHYMDFSRKVKMHPVDLSFYKKINHIGDIHGNYRLLREFIEDIKEDEFYIFHGDYIDGGEDSHLVIDFLYRIVDRKNVVILRGNHEKSLFKLVEGIDTDYDHFENITRKKIEGLSDWKNKTKYVLSFLKDAFYYIYDDIEMIATHGGLSSYTDDLYRIPSKTLINGAGGKKNTYWVCKNFEESVAGRPIFQSFGHRSTDSDRSFLVCRHSFNLNGDAERHRNFFKAVVIKKGYEKGYSRLYRNVFYRNVFLEEKTYNKYTKRDFVKKEDLIKE